MITFEQRVLNAEYKLNETEESIIDYIKNTNDDISNMAINKLAKKTFVAPNAITRLCRKLNYSGFVELKLALRDQSKDKAEKNNVGQRETIDYNFELIDRQREDKAINLLLKARKILFFAVGETSYVAHNFAYMFNAINQKTQFVTYENQIIYDIRNDTNLIIFCISQSGETYQVLRVAEEAKINDQKIISLTGLYKNSLENLADISLFSYSKRRQWHGYNFTDKTPLFIVMNSLFDRYYLNIV